MCLVIVETQVNLSVMSLKLPLRRCRIALVIWIEMPLRIFLIPSTGKVVLIALRYVWTILWGQSLDVIVIVVIVIVVPLIFII